MKLIEALGDLATTVKYLRSQYLATELDPEKELLPLTDACATQSKIHIWDCAR
jgi:hypothetical protein